MTYTIISLQYFLSILSPHILDVCWHILFSDLLGWGSFQKEIGMEVRCKLGVSEKCEVALGRLS